MAIPSQEIKVSYPIRKCTICMGAGKLLDATYVTQDANECQWYSCEEHKDFQANDLPVVSITIEEWWQKVFGASPESSEEQNGKEETQGPQIYSKNQQEAEDTFPETFFEAEYTEEENPQEGESKAQHEQASSSGGSEKSEKGEGGSTSDENSKS